MPWQRGDVIKIQYGSHMIKRRLGGNPKENQGGEGFVVPLGGKKDVVVKVFHCYDVLEQPQTIEEKQRKISQLVKFYQLLHEQSPNVCWPQNLAFDVQGRFCGFTMRRVQGTLLSNYGNYDANGFRVITKDLLVVLRNVLETIDQTHKTMQRNGNPYILIGDIQPNNFIVNTKTKKCYLIDADSFQIGVYRCDLNFPNYHSPERLRNNGNYVRDIYEEYYVVSYLLFETLTGGKVRPYQYRNGSADSDEAVRQGFFALTRDPDLAPRIATAYWNAFPADVRELFRRAFDVSHPANGNNRELRPTIGEWQACLDGWIGNFKALRSNPNGTSSPKKTDSGCCLAVIIFVFIFILMFITALALAISENVNSSNSTSSESNAISSSQSYPTKYEGVKYYPTVESYNPVGGDERAYPFESSVNRNSVAVEKIQSRTQADIDVPHADAPQNEPMLIEEVRFQRSAFKVVKDDEFERKPTQEIISKEEEAEGLLQKGEVAAKIESVQKNDVEQTSPKVEIERNKAREPSVAYMETRLKADHVPGTKAKTRRKALKEQVVAYADTEAPLQTAIYAEKTTTKGEAKSGKNQATSSESSDPRFRPRLSRELFHTW